MNINAKACLTLSLSPFASVKILAVSCVSNSANPTSGSVPDDAACREYHSNDKELGDAGIASDPSRDSLETLHAIVSEE